MSKSIVATLSYMLYWLTLFWFIYRVAYKFGSSTPNQMAIILGFSFVAYDIRNTLAYDELTPDSTQKQALVNLSAFFALLLSHLFLTVVFSLFEYQVV